jgi:hypothetical protein
MVGRWSTTLLWFSVVVVMAPAPTANAGDSVALTLATARIESLPPAKRDHNTEMVLTKTSGTVPAGTREILPTLVFHTGASGYAGGAADNLSLELS